MSETTEVTSVSCNHCGASLPIAGDTRFVTCGYCASQLEVHRSGPAVYTQVLAEVVQRTVRIESEVRELKLRSDLEELQREWNARRPSLMDHNKDGTYDVPTTEGSITTMVLILILGTCWTVYAIAAGLGFAPLLGILVILVGIFIGKSGCRKANEYARAEAAYEQQRQRLLKASEE